MNKRTTMLESSLGVHIDVFQSDLLLFAGARLLKLAQRVGRGKTFTITQSNTTKTKTSKHTAEKADKTKEAHLCRHPCSRPSYLLPLQPSCVGARVCCQQVQIPAQTTRFSGRERPQNQSVCVFACVRFCEEKRSNLFFACEFDHVNAKRS